MTLVHRVVKYDIYKGNQDFDILDQYCYYAKNMYNMVTYIYRQLQCNLLDNIEEYKSAIKTIEYNYKKDDGTKVESSYNVINEYQLVNILKTNNQSDFRNLKSNDAQQIVYLVGKNFKSFYKSTREYYKKPRSFTGKPKLPGYKDKDGRSIIPISQFSLSVDGYLKFDRKIILKNVKISIPKKDIKQIRFIPHPNKITVEIVYNKEIQEHERGEYNAAIDLGVNNLCTITSDKDLNPLIINGRMIKSINQYYNKIVSALKSQLVNNQQTSKRIYNITDKRNKQIKHLLHNISKYIVLYCKENNIGTIYIGKNDGWKNEVNLGTKTNQNFVSIPYNTLIDMIKYKAQEYNIVINTIVESYTSKCSALDNEPVCFHESYVGKRIKRGLFQSKSHGVINADVNGALNILRLGSKKDLIPNKCWFNPIKVSSNFNRIGSSDVVTTSL